MNYLTNNRNQALLLTHASNNLQLKQRQGMIILSLPHKKLSFEDNQTIFVIRLYLEKMCYVKVSYLLHYSNKKALTTLKLV